jgi:pimeloyl-ACP methyl ester carboxylesterase
LGHIEDIEYLLDYLGIQRFNVLGVSGGGRYALAAAYHFPSSRLRKTAIMCGAPHPTFENNMQHASWKRQSLYTRYLTSLWRWYVHRKGFNDFRGNKEHTEEQNYHNWAITMERNLQDQKGYVHDLKLSAQPWGFELEDIRANRIMWFHGALDKNTTCEAARATAEMVGGEGVDFQPFPDLDHYNLVRMTKQMILEWLRK